MYMVNVNSIVISAVGYDEPNEVLRLNFKSGKVYDYQNVPPRTYQLLMRSPSKGEYFNESIKDKYTVLEVLPTC